MSAPAPAAAGRQQAIAAVWRRLDHHEWRDVELIGRAAGQLVLRETGRFYNGVFLAPPDQVRLAGGVLELRPAFGVAA